MSGIDSPAPAGDWMKLAEERLDDQANRVTVETKVAFQLQGLRWQATNLGVGARAVEAFFRDSQDEKDKRTNESDAHRVGRVLDRYL